MRLPRILLSYRQIFMLAAIEIKTMRRLSECLLIKGNACFHYNSETVSVVSSGAARQIFAQAGALLFCVLLRYDTQLSQPESSGT